MVTEYYPWKIVLQIIKATDISFNLYDFLKKWETC
jgi:hypothetical protein